MSSLLSALLLAAAIGSPSADSPDPRILMPPRVKVMPIFFVPAGEAKPTEDQSRLFMRHLEWTRRRYAELLPGHLTFGVAAKQPLVIPGRESLAHYRGLPELGASQFVAEALEFLKYTQRNCPYILLMLIVNPVDDWPGGCAQPLNGGFDTGPGMVLLPSLGLTKYPIFQSSLQHELGHSFGLPHVEEYGYSMATNDSLMSYNVKHHTNFFEPSPTPGNMIPEDIRALAYNQRVFHGLRFDPKRDVPEGYKIAPILMGLGPMEVPGQLPAVKYSTESGEADGSQTFCLRVGELTLVKPGGIPAFVASEMWRSSKSPDGSVSLKVEFPIAVPITRLVFHTMPLGGPDAAHAVRVSVLGPDGSYRKVADKEFNSADDGFGITKTTGSVWRFEFRTDPEKSVVVRGIEYFCGRDQFFPPLIAFRHRAAARVK